jgi:hypothetical protein
MANNTPEPVKVNLTEMDLMQLDHMLTKARRTRRFVVGWPWGSNFIRALGDELERFGFVVGDDPLYEGTDQAAIIVATTLERLAEAQEEVRRNLERVASEDYCHGPRRVTSEEAIKQREEYERGTDPCWAFSQDWKHIHWEADVPYLKNRFDIDLRLVSEDKGEKGYWLTFEVSYNGRHHDDASVGKAR